MSIPRRFASKRPRRGMVTVQVALALTGLMGVVAIVADGGILLAQRRHAQAVADAAALAAAADLYEKFKTNGGVDGGSASTSALATASANGYKNDAVAADGTGNAASTSTVVVQMSPNNYLGGPHAGTAVPKGYAEATVTYYQGRGFSAVFGSGTIPISARAVARGRVVAQYPASILLLDTASTQGALTASGSAALTTSGEVMVNSSNSKAVVVSGGANLTATTLNINGGDSGSGSGISATVNTGVAQVADPLAGIAAPVAASYTVQSTSNLNIGSGTRTLSAGEYTGGIAINGGTVTLNPGVYYINGGGFKVNGGSSSVTGSGVMIYNVPASSGDVITVTGGGTISLSPPTSGPYAGITMFQRSPSYPNANPTISGGSSANITGTLYFPTNDLTVSASSASAVLGSQYISDDLTVTGSATLTLTTNAQNVANQRQVGLVE